MSDLDLLRRLGDDLVPPPFGALRETAKRRDRRSAAGTAVVAGIAVAVIATAVGLLTPDGDRVPEPIESPTQVVPTSRPLTYADGSTIHYGDQTIESDGPVVELDVTDDGVAFRTADGGIWFTDGSTTEEIGELGEPVEPGGDLDAWAMRSDFTDGRSTGWIVSGNSGSLLLWFDFTDPRTPQVVVYDTDTRTNVLRTEVTIPSGSWAGPQSVNEDSAYLFRDPTRSPTTRCRRCGSS